MHAPIASPHSRRSPAAASGRQQTLSGSLRGTAAPRTAVIQLSTDWCASLTGPPTTVSEDPHTTHCCPWPSSRRTTGLPRNLTFTHAPSKPETATAASCPPTVSHRIGRAWPAHDPGMASASQSGSGPLQAESRHACRPLDGRVPRDACSSIRAAR